MPTKTTIDNRLFHRKLTRQLSTTVVTDNYQERDFESVKTGVKLVGWQKIVKSRGNATTPYSVEATKVVTSTPGNYTVSGVYGLLSNPRTFSERFEGTNNVPSASISHLTADSYKADSKALTALYRKVNAQISQAKVPSALVEFRDVVRQFGSPFRSILALTERHINRLYLQRRGIHALRYNREKLSKVLSDTYLEYAFGLAPLISDTKKAAEALARFFGEHELTPPTKLVGRGLDSASLLSSGSGLPYGNPGEVLTVKYTRKTTTEARCQYVAGYTSFLTADIGSRERLGELLGFRPESWIPAAWEGVPWSWLVDYFTNVQGILDSLSASKVHPSWICKTVLTITDVDLAEQLNVAETLRLANNNGMRVGSTTTNQGSVKLRRTTMVRSIPANLGLPSVYFQLPDSMRQFAAMSAVLLSKQSSPPMISLEKNYRNFLRGK